MSHLLIKCAAFSITLLGLAPTVALAGPINLVTNGSFEETTAATSGLKITGGSDGSLTGWVNNAYTGTSPGYNFLYFPNGGYGVGLPLWGPIPNSPDGGNFVGMDGAYQQSALSQTINGLTVGGYYYVSFDFAGAQQNGFTGITTEQFAVALQASGALAPTATCATAGVQCTTVLTDQSHGFTGWNTAGFTFIATSASETLSFLAIGTPSGEPPFSLLDGVSMVVPEPSSMIAVVGLGALLAARMRRRRA